MEPNSSQTPRSRVNASTSRRNPPSLSRTRGSALSGHTIQRAPASAPRRERRHTRPSIACSLARSHRLSSGTLGCSAATFTAGPAGRNAGAASAAPDQPAIATASQTAPARRSPGTSNASSALPARYTRSERPIAPVTGSGASNAGTGVSAAAAGFQGKIHGGKRCNSANAARASGSATIRSPSGTRLAAFEELQRFPPWIFPWNPAAAALTPVPALLTPLPVTGAIGLSLLVYLAGSALDALLVPGLRRAGAVWLAVAIAGWSGAALAAPAFRPAGPAVKVAALQPNVPLERRWDPANEQAIEGRVWRLSHRGADAGARWIVWPESALPRVLESDGGFRREVEAFTRERGVWLLFGAIGLGAGEDEYYNSVYEASPAPRPM